MRPLLPLLACASVLVASEQPNFLCVVSEDSVRYLGCYGDAVARTPVLDALARESVLFEHCYTCPSR